MNENVRRWWPWLAALIGVAVVNGWVLARWVQKDTRPLAWDESIHTHVAMDYRERWREEGPFAVLEPALFNYPPLYHVSVAAALGKTDDVGDTGALVNFFYLLMLMGAVFASAHVLMGSWPALAATTLLTAYPIVADMMRPTMTDISLTAWVALAFYFLLRSEDFHRPVWSGLFGLALGLGMLTKWSACLYLAGPFLFSSVRALRRKNWKWLALSMGVAGIVMAPWYSINLIPMMSRLSKVTSLPPASGVVLGPWTGWLWYPLSLFEQLDLLFLLLLLPGLAVVFWRPKLWPVALWFFVSLALFTLIRNRNVRYALPALPAAAMLSVAWLPPFRRWIFAGVTALALVFTLVNSLLPGLVGPLRIGSFEISVTDNRPPLDSDWKHREIIRRIDALRDPNAPFTRIVTVSNAAHFHSTTLNVTLRSMGIREFRFKGPSKRRWLELSEFILYKTGERGPAFSAGTVNACADFLENPPGWFGRVFREKDRWPLPDGSTAILYQCDPLPVRDVDAGLLNVELKELVLPKLKATDVMLRARPRSAKDTAVGRYDELLLSARRLEYQGVAFDDVSVRLVEPQVNLPLFLETQEIQLLSLRALYPRAAVSETGLTELLERKAGWIKRPDIRFENSALIVQAALSGIPVKLVARIKVSGDQLTTRLMSWRLAGIPLPKVFVRAVTNRRVTLRPNSETPFALKVGEIQGDDQWLRIVPAS